MKILMIAGGTGGHVFPALTIAKKFEEHGNDISWIGKLDSLEERIALEEGFHFFPIQAKGFLGKNFIEKIGAIFTLSISILKSIVLIIRIKPDLAISTGGYLSLAPGLATIFLCPLYIHEQNSIPGISNRILHRISKRTFEAFPGTFKQATQKVINVGNPIRDEISRIAELDKIEDDKFRILILGGSQGSQQINDILIQALHDKKNLSHWILTHQVGQLNTTKLKEAYIKSGVKFVIKEFIEDIATAYRESDIIISRSGAMSVTEICSAQKACILLPLPWSADNHQFFNAKFLADRGAAQMIESDISNAEILYELLIDLEKDDNKRNSMKRAAGKVFPSSTSERIFNCINESLKF